MFVNLVWPLNASIPLSASAELLVIKCDPNYFFSISCGRGTRSTSVKTAYTSLFAPTTTSSVVHASAIPVGQMQVTVYLKVVYVKYLCGRPPQYIPRRASGDRVTCDVGYLCANFSFPERLCSRFGQAVRDRQTDVRRLTVVKRLTDVMSSLLNRVRK